MSGEPIERVGATPVERATPAGDAVAGAVALALAVLAAFVVVPLGIFVPARAVGTINSPAFFPHLLLLVAGVLGALLLAQGLRERRRRPQGRGASTTDWMRALGMLAIGGAYVVLIFVLGLPLASGLALAVALVHFGERRLALVAATAVLVPLVLWAFFVQVASVPMPASLLARWLGASG